MGVTLDGVRLLEAENCSVPATSADRFRSFKKCCDGVRHIGWSICEDALGPLDKAIGTESSLRLIISSNCFGAHYCCAFRY